MSHSALRGWAMAGAKAAVSVALIAFALRGIDSRTVLDNLRNADSISIAVAIAIVLAIAPLQARRWEIVLARMEHAVPFAQALKLVLISIFFNQTLPSTIGGDAYRAWATYKLGIHAGNAIASVLVDRILGLVSLVVMIAAGLAWLFEIVREGNARAGMIALIAACAIGMAVLLSLARFAPALRRWRITRLLVHVSEGARAVISNPGAALEVLLISVAGFAAFSYAAHVLARGLGVDLALGDALLLVPLVALVTVLPISIAGWGLRESAMVVALGLVGVPSVQPFSLSVLLGLVVMASGIPGGLLWLLTRRTRAPHDGAMPSEPAPARPGSIPPE